MKACNIGENMRSSRRRLPSLVSLALAITLLLAISPVRASPGITLEKSEEWYGDGDTIVHSVYAENVDGDAQIEIITVGEVYKRANTRTEAQMKIWNWNSNMQTLTLEATKEWSLGGSKTVALSVYAADVDNDGNTEIVTVGYGRTQNNSLNCDLLVWQYAMGDYIIEHEYSQSVDTIYNSVYATQIDTSDDELEIVIAGVDLGSPDSATLYIETWNQTTMTLKDSVEWGPDDYDANATAVYARNVDGDGLVEILTVGYYYDASNDQHAELRVWNYDSSSLNFEDDQPWQRRSGSDTEARSVFAENIDGIDGIEIVTCGRVIDSQTGEPWGDLESFTHSGSTISDDRDIQWQGSDDDDTVCSSVFVKEVTDDIAMDIITGGGTLVSGTQNGQIVVWSAQVGTFQEQGSTEWYTTDDTEVHSVFSGDIDADDEVEILSGGEAYDGTRIRAQLRIWYWT